MQSSLYLLYICWRSSFPLPFLPSNSKYIYIYIYIFYYSILCYIILCNVIFRPPTHHTLSIPSGPFFMGCEIFSVQSDLSLIGAQKCGCGSVPRIVCCPAVGNWRIGQGLAEFPSGKGAGSSNVVFCYLPLYLKERLLVGLNFSWLDPH